MINDQGYAFIQNIVATAILQVETNSNSAAIDLMNIPIPSDNIITD
jgi:TATA-box binding protein (TBP) (component of TFIID and TFIIIB)